MPRCGVLTSPFAFRHQAAPGDGIALHRSAGTVGDQDIDGALCCRWGELPIDTPDYSSLTVETNSTGATEE